MASSSAITTRVGNVDGLSLGSLGVQCRVAPQCERPIRSVGLDEQAVEELVLGLLEAGDLGAHLPAVALHRIGVTLGLAVLAPGERRLGHERAEPGLLGLVGQMGELLVGHAQLGSQRLEAVAHLDEAAFDERVGHAQPYCRTFGNPDARAVVGKGTAHATTPVPSRAPSARGWRPPWSHPPGTGVDQPLIRLESVVVLISADAGNRHRPRLSLRWFVLIALVGGVVAFIAAAQAGLIDPALFRVEASSRTEVHADPTVVLEALTEQADLVVAERNIAATTVEADNVVTVRVPLLGEQDLPRSLAGEQETAVVGPGRVELRVDLADLRPTDLTVEGGTVHIDAPLPRIAEVDEGPVRTLDERTGLLTRTGEVLTGDGQAIQQQRLADAGHDQMLAGARQDAELFDLGRSSLERSLQRLLIALPGVDRVQVDFPTVGATCTTHRAPGFCAANRGAELGVPGPQ